MTTARRLRGSESYCQVRPGADTWMKARAWVELPSISTCISFYACPCPTGDGTSYKVVPSLWSFLLATSGLPAPLIPNPIVILFLFKRFSDRFILVHWKLARIRQLPSTRPRLCLLGCISLNTHYRVWRVHHRQKWPLTHFTLSR